MPMIKNYTPTTKIKTKKISEIKPRKTVLDFLLNYSLSADSFCSGDVKFIISKN